MREQRFLNLVSPRISKIFFEKVTKRGEKGGFLDSDG